MYSKTIDKKMLILAVQGRLVLKPFSVQRSKRKEKGLVQSSTGRRCSAGGSGMGGRAPKNLLGQEGTGHRKNYWGYLAPY